MRGGRRGSTRDDSEDTEIYFYIFIRLAFQVLGARAAFSDYTCNLEDFFYFVILFYSIGMRLLIVRYG
jgi:hypothetical protein